MPLCCRRSLSLVDVGLLLLLLMIFESNLLGKLYAMEPDDLCLFFVPPAAQSSDLSMHKHSLCPLQFNQWTKLFFNGRRTHL